MITLDELTAMLVYHPATGTFTWRANFGQRCRVGATAGSAHKDGYLQVQLKRKKYLLHRLVWVFETGTWPTAQIDHINGDRKDNSFVNLREANHSLNLQNQRHARADNQTGLLGATRNGRRFKAVITLRGVRTFLGNFPTPELAHAAYLLAKRAMHPANQL
jgi:hypothetical protein